MYWLSSTSQTVAPRPRAMNRGVPPTARKARTGESTPPGRSVSASAKSAAEVLVNKASLLAQPARHSFREVGERQIRPRPGDRQQRLLDGSPLIEPPALDRGGQHRVLAAHVVGRKRDV